MEKFVTLAVVIGLGLSAQARADAWSDYSSSYDNFMSQATTVQAQDTAEWQQSRDNLVAKQKKLEAKQEKEKAKLAQHQETIASLSATQQATEDKINKLNKDMPSEGHILFFKTKSRQQKEVEHEQQSLTTIQQELTDENAAQEAEKQKLAATAAELGVAPDATKGIAGSGVAGEVASMEIAVNKKNVTLKEIQTPSFQAITAENQARKVISAQKENGYDAKFLFSDLQNLQQKNKISALQVQAMKKVWDTQLNNTLMGEYVNSQIKKGLASVCDPAFQNACAAKNADGFNAYMNGKLNAPKQGDVAVPAPAVQEQNGAKSFPLPDQDQPKSVPVQPVTPSKSNVGT